MTPLPRVSFIAQRARAKLAETGAACDVVLAWNTLTGGTLDARTQSLVGATAAPQTATVRAFAHYLQAGSFVVRDFLEIEAGDCILDFAPDVVLDGLHGLTFTFNGATWGQKPMSEALAKHWDTVIGNTRILRSVLVRKL